MLKNGHKPTRLFKSVNVKAIVLPSCECGPWKLLITRNHTHNLAKQ